MSELPVRDRFMVKARQRAFLRIYADVGNVKRTAAIVGVSRRIHYVWLERDPEYALEFESARERAYDVLHDEALRRAMGYRVPVYYKGVKVGTMKKYSDTLLMLLLKQMLPEYYGEITPSKKAQRRAKTR
jgi:hypothetical protein